MHKTTKVSKRASDWQRSPARLLIYSNAWVPEFAVLRDRMTIGRDPEASLQIADESMTRLHARVSHSRVHNRFSIIDLKSRNGTFIDGRPAQSAPLRNGSVIRMGETVAVVDLDGLPLIDPSTSPYDQLQQSRIPNWRAQDTHLMIVGEPGVGKRRLANRISAPSSGEDTQPLVFHCSVATDAGIFEALDAFSKQHTRDDSRCSLAILSRVEQLGLEAQRALLARLDASEAGQLNPVRCISVASSQILDMVRDGEFDRSLFHRLAQPVIELTPVRDRAGEACRFFGSRLSGFAPSADLLEAISLYTWPGNFHELAAVTEHLLSTASSSLLHASQLPEAMRGGFITPSDGPVEKANEPPQTAASPVSLPLPVTSKPSAVELTQWLLACNGNVSALSRRIGKHRNQVVRWLKSYDLPTGHIDFVEWRRSLPQ